MTTAGKKISQLTEATTANAADILPIVQGSETKFVSKETFLNDYYSREEVDGLNSAFEQVSQKGQPDGYVPLGPSGKIASQYIPAIALTDVYVVADEAERDALEVQEGDFAVVTGTGATFVYSGTEWIVAATSLAVSSVNGQIGTVVLDTGNVSEGSNLYYTDARVATYLSSNNFLHAGDPVSALTNDAGYLVSSDIVSFETTAQLNARDTANRSRANHTGTQAIATISGLQGALDDKAPIDHSHTVADISDFPTLATVATSGDYNDLSNLPDLSLYDNLDVFADVADFPISGSADVLYVETSTGHIYRWTGSAYAIISAQLALGETSSTAYRGDRGKSAYDHSQLTSGNPHNVTKSNVGLGNVDNTSDINKPISSAVQTALNAKISSQWTTSGSNIYYNSGNVGIGTNNPTAGKLQVNGVVSLGATGNYYKGYNEDSVNVKYANWFENTGNQWGQGQLNNQIFFLGVNSNPTRNSIGFYAGAAPDGVSATNAISAIYAVGQIFKSSALLGWSASAGASTAGGAPAFDSAFSRLSANKVALGNGGASDASGTLIVGNVGIGTTDPTAKLDISSDILRLRTAKTPSTAGAAGNQGDLCWDASFVYVCVATNSWKRAALSAW